MLRLREWIFLCVVFAGLLRIVKCREGEEEEVVMTYKRLESPFRMNKINLLWNKIRVSNQISDESKLKAFYGKLKLQEKEEFALKKLKGEGKDKEGLFEDQVRKKFKFLLDEFSLGRYHEEEGKLAEGSFRAQRELTPFKDKKLLKLWEKAGNLGLQEEALSLLKEELQHHQAKVDEYHRLNDLAKAQNMISPNEIHDSDPEMDLKDKRRDIKADYAKLEMKITNIVDGSSVEFKNPEVLSLWRMAVDGSFDSEELESLKQELEHFEKRIEKVKLLESELQLVDERQSRGFNEHGDKTEGRKILDKKLKKHVKTLNETREHLKFKIASRHSEL